MKATHHNQVPNTLEELYQSFYKRLSTNTVDQLVEAFNRETQSRAWVGARAAYLKALKVCMDEAGIGMDAIFRDNTLLLNHRIKLNENRQAIPLVESSGGGRMILL